MQRLPPHNAQDEVGEKFTFPVFTFPFQVPMPISLSPETSSCRCIALRGSDVVIRQDGEAMEFTDLKELQALSASSLFFEEKHTDICVLGIPQTSPIPERFDTTTLRNYFAEHGETRTLPYFRAKALYEWLDRTQFCPRCGTHLVPGTNEEETSLVCTNCHNTIFPRIEPCIIVLVNHGNDILLALHRNRISKYYSCIAGFMEAGESAEQAVRREIMEETGISVKNIRYFGSQSWPFPSQLMLAFTAEYESGKIHIQESELQRAAWFPRNNCPATPPKGSIAYRLIHGE